MMDNMIAILIPIYNQSKYINSILDGIKMQTVLPDTVYLLLDRPSDVDIKYILSKIQSYLLNIKVMVINDIPEYIGRPQENPNDNFLTGYVRNKGIQQAIDDGHTTFIFIDGDCVPEHHLVKSHYILTNNNLPVITAGKRNEEYLNWTDVRETNSDIYNCNLFNKPHGFKVDNIYYLQSSSIIWTCNVALNISAVNLIRRLNSKYYGRYELFNSEFLGSWGGEDGFLGLQAFYANVNICISTIPNSGIRHIDHPRPENKYDAPAWLKYYEQKLNELNDMIAIDPITILDLIQD